LKGFPYERAEPRFASEPWPPLDGPDRNDDFGFLLPPNDPELGALLSSLDFLNDFPDLSLPEVDLPGRDERFLSRPLSLRLGIGLL
jgi:hypothetical protein